MHLQYPTLLFVVHIQSGLVAWQDLNDSMFLVQGVIPISVYVDVLQYSEVPFWIEWFWTCLICTFSLFELSCNAINDMQTIYSR